MQEKEFEISLEQVMDTMPSLSAEELVTWFLENPTTDKTILRAQYNRLGDGESARLKGVMGSVDWGNNPPVLREKA